MNISIATDKKIQAVVWLFGLFAVINLIRGITGLFDNASYGEYGDAFISFFIYLYLAIAVKKGKSKVVHVTALIFSVIVMVKGILVSGLFSLYSQPVPAEVVVWLIFGFLAFGLIPFYFLLQKDVKAHCGYNGSN